MVFRFGENSVWDPKDVHVHHGCRIWKSILKFKGVFWKFIHFVLGSSSEIKFWEDVWVGEVLLKKRFTGLFSLTMSRDASVVESFNFGDHMQWPRFRRNLFDWEIGDMVRLFNLLEVIKPDINKTNQWSGPLIGKVFSPLNLCMLN